MGIAAFVVGLIADIWGIRSDNIDIKKHKQEQKQEQIKEDYPSPYPVDGWQIENKIEE